MQVVRRVLLVDDEPEFLGALRRVVEELRPDVRVVYACDVATAEWQIQSTTICYVLTDLRLDGDDAAGLRVVAAARSLGLPAAIITARSEAEWPDSAAGVPVVRKTGDIRGDLRALLAGTLRG